MDVLTPNRQQLVKAIEKLPIEVLPELASFVEYLRYKVTHRTSMSEPIVEENSASAFLLSIAGIGASAENDFSQEDEEILASDRTYSNTNFPVSLFCASVRSRFLNFTDICNKRDRFEVKLSNHSP